MELQTFIEREIAADPFFILPSSVPNLIVAHPMFRYQDPKLAGWKAGLKTAVWFLANNSELHTYLEFIMKYSVVTTKFVFVFVNLYLFEISNGNHAKLYENVV